MPKVTYTVAFYFLKNYYKFLIYMFMLIAEWNSWRLGSWAEGAELFAGK